MVNIAPARFAWVVLSAVLCLPAGRGHAQVFERTDAQKEIELGRQAAAEVDRAVALSTDRRMVERVRRIGTALVGAMPQRKYPYEFKVLELQDFNAFCLPGGFMYVFEGLLNRLPDDDEVAFVMAHEITHASHRHWKRMAEKMRGPAVLAVLASATTGLGDVAGLTADILGAGYSREQEDDADAGGVSLAYAAGYDPSGAVRAAEVMLALETRAAVPLYLRSHPPAKQRVARLQTRAADIKAAAPASASGGRIPPVVAPVAPPEGARANVLYPLAAGNSWTYEIRSALTRSRYALEVSGGIPTDSGWSWRTTVRMPSAGPVEFVFATTPDAVWRRALRDTPGSTWQLEFSLVDRPEAAGGWQVVGRESVTTPCGVFADALHIRQTKRDAVTDAWLAPGVGLVRRVAGGVDEILVAYRVDRKD